MQIFHFDLFRMNLKTSFLMLVSVACFNKISGQSSHSLNKKGDAFYDQSEFKKADEQYQKATEKEPKNSRPIFNSANSAFEMGEYARAIDLFKKAIEKTEKADEKAAAWHNIGNAHFQQQQWQESVDAFKNALRLKGDDAETKKNLALAQKQLKKQQEDQQKQQQQDQQKQNEKDQSEQSENESENQPPKDPKMSKKEAQDLLKILNEEEKKAQQKPKKDGQRGRAQRKDW